MKIIGMIYKNHDEARAAFLRVYPHIRIDTIVSVRMYDMIHTTTGKVFFLSAEYPRHLRQYTFDSVFVDEHVPHSEELMEIIDERTRGPKDPIEYCKRIFDKMRK